jgi:hypothetical protein
VLPDLRTLLLECISPAAVAAAEGAHLPSAARHDVQWVDSQATKDPQLWETMKFLTIMPPLASKIGWDDSISEQLVAQLLQQGQQQHGAAANSRQQPVRLSNLEHIMGQLCTR